MQSVTIFLLENISAFGVFANINWTGPAGGGYWKKSRTKMATKSNPFQLASYLTTSQLLCPITMPQIVPNVYF